MNYAKRFIFGNLNDLVFGHFGNLLQGFILLSLFMAQLCIFSNIQDTANEYVMPMRELEESSKVRSEVAGL